jgi:hypothetical protein
VSQNARTAFQRLLYSCFLKSCLFTAASYSCFFTAASSQLAGLESPSLSHSKKKTREAQRHFVSPPALTLPPSCFLRQRSTGISTIPIRCIIFDYGPALPGCGRDVVFCRAGSSDMAHDGHGIREHVRDLRRGRIRGHVHVLTMSSVDATIFAREAHPCATFRSEIGAAERAIA